MPNFLLPDGAKLNYTDKGQGQPVVFIHGVWMSSRFFKRQQAFFSKRYRFVALDLRGHGRSSHIPRGHTLGTYAADLRAFMKGLGLTDAVLVGWSMGGFLIWEYFRHFGAENVRATVVVSETASDYKRDDWPLGAFDFPSLCDMMKRVQTDRPKLVNEFIDLMFKEPVSAKDREWIFKEITRLPETIASAILFDQTVQDYRPVLPQVNVPTLLCWGRDEKLIPIAGATHLQQTMPQTRLVIFEKSGHCPFLEEPGRFNRTVDEFIQSL